MRQIRYLGKSLRVIVEHPDGGLLSLPASETSLELKGPSLQVEGKTPKFEPSRLLRLVEWLAKKDSAATSEISLGQQHQEIVPRKIDDTTAQITQSHSPGNGRPQPALNQSDSEIGGQNARSRSTGTYAQGEQN